MTGAGQGIGRGIARALASDGALVVLAGRTLEKLESVATEIRSDGGDAIAVVCDVEVRSQVDHLVEQTVAAYGGLSILINNAQSFVFRTLEEMTEDDLAVAYRSGPIGTFHLMQASLPHLKAAGGGSIVNMATTAAFTGERTFGSYAMAKEAIRALTKVAATEWGPFDIRVNCVCPSASSPAYEEWTAANPDKAAELSALRPLGRMGDPLDDIGRAVAALVSDDMRYLTGGTLMLNGGRFYLG